MQEKWRSEKEMYNYDHLIKKLKEIDPSFPIKEKPKKKILKFQEGKVEKTENKVKLDKAV